MSILDFKAALQGGGARPNQFRVTLNFPTFVTGGSAAARKGQFLCNSSSLPGSYLGEAITYYRGRPAKMSGERVFQNWQIKIVNDTDFAIRDAFEQWSNAMNDVRENTGLTNPLSYTTDMLIEHLDRNDNVIKSYRIDDAWPVSVSEIGLDFGQNDVIEEFTVEISYSFWETTTSAASNNFSAGIFGSTV